MDELDINMRRATVEDAALVAEITHAAYGIHVPALGRKPQPMTANYRDMLVQPGHDIWLFELSGDAVGLLVLVREEEALFVYSLAVRPEKHGNGFGGFLLKFAEAQAMRAGLQMVRLYTNALMGDNVAFYLAHGYHETSREPARPGATVYLAKVL
jgi:GNAT superfamily N-acetyltransferase